MNSFRLLRFKSAGLLIAFSVLFSQIIGCSFAQEIDRVFIDRDTNSIQVTCVGRNNYYFYNINAGMLEHSPIRLTSFGSYTFVITPENETAVACTDSSPPVVIAAFPMYSMAEIKTLARIGDMQQLECPYNLGTAHTLLEPYHHVWLNGANTRIANQTSRILLINVTEDSPEEYSCAIRLKPCNTTCIEAIHPDPVTRVKFDIAKVGPISMVTPPVNQTITEDGAAVFNCSANGPSIEIIWNYNGMNYTENSEDSNIVIVTGNCTNCVSSMLRIESVKTSGTVSCIVHQSFDGSLSSINNQNFDVDLQDDYYCSTASLIVEPIRVTTPTSYSSPTTTTLAIEVTNSFLTPPVKITLISLAIVIVVAIAVVVSLVIFLYCHYHYKYKRNSSKLGRFLSRAISKPSNRATGTLYQNNNNVTDLPADSNGHVLATCFQSSHSINQPPTDSGLAHSSVRSQNDKQDLEPIYNTSLYSNASGGSYSGLSGVSNQEPGAQYKMPQYCATDVSGSGNPQTSITSGGHLAPPYHHGNSNGRSQRSSDVSENSVHSRQCSNDPHQIKLTHEALIQHQHKASSYNAIPNTAQTYSALVHGTNYPHTIQNDNQYHSDTHLVRPHNSLFQANLPSPALATIETTHFYQTSAPFPHNEPAPTQAPFPNKDSNCAARISEATIERVLDSLMHNRNCLIPNCTCYSARKLYKVKMANKQRAATLQYQNSSSSDSDSAIDKRSRLFLPLSSQDASSLHPHYHPGSKMRARSVYPRSKLSRRRSRSLDLTPVPEVSPTKTPKVGGSLVPDTPVYAPPSLQDATANEHLFSLGGGEKKELSQSYFFAATPNYPSPCTPDCNLNKLNSLSADNLPILCLNDCPLLNTPREEIKALNQRPINPSLTESMAGKLALSTINEKNKEADTDGSNTSSRSDSPPNFSKAAQSNQASRSSRASKVKSDSQMSHEDSIDWNSITKEGLDRDLSQGYQSETLSSLSISNLKPASKRSVSKPAGSDHSQRSASPAYETYVTVSDDGSTVHTTEC